MRNLLPIDVSAKCAKIQSGGTAISPGFKSEPAVVEQEAFREPAQL